MDKRKISRRDFLKVSAITFVGTVATACGVAATPTAQATKEVQATSVAPAGGKEPPLLQPRVDAGDLPPLSERLPESPAVVGDRDAIGVYGGEVRMIHFDPVWCRQRLRLEYRAPAALFGSGPAHDRAEYLRKLGSIPGW